MRLSAATDEIAHGIRGFGEVGSSFETAPAEEVLAWALERFHPRLALVTSFQAEGVVLLDLAYRLEPRVRVITIDSGRLPQETFEVMERVRDHYGIEIEVFMPDPARVEQMVREGGPDLFRRSVEERQRCCQVRKVEPLERALAGVDAWVTGLRRDQTAERAATPKVALERRGTAGQERTRFKLAPLADWSHEQVWSYLETHRVPHHPLYDRGFTSIGCLPCTRATAPGEDPRAGRWWWEQGGHKECGLHLVRDVVRGIGFHGQLAAGRR